jgi:hypothetical protein
MKIRGIMDKCAAKENIHKKAKPHLAAEAARTVDHPSKSESKSSWM